MTDIRGLLRRNKSSVLVLLASLVLAFSLTAQDAGADSDNPEIDFLTCKVLVVDPDGNPVQDALVSGSGLRTRIEPGKAWFWLPERHGPVTKLKTGEDGIVEMPYPKFAAEKLEVGQVTWTVEHPDFVHFREGRSVDDDPAKIALARGFRIAVTAVNRATGDKIKTDLYAVIGGSMADWKLANNGMLVSPVFAKQDNWLRVCQVVEGQPTLFSEAIKIVPGDRSRILLKDIKLAMGTRVEGALDQYVTRPIENGQVSATIVRTTKHNGSRTRWSWRDKTPINEDGTFVFESLPSDEVLQMIPICDGWVPSRRTKESILKFFPDDLRRLNSGVSLPQLVELHGESVTVTLDMDRGTSVKATVTGPNGEPLSGAKLEMWPNQYHFDSGSNVLGAGFSWSQMLVETRRGSFKFERPNRFRATTNEKGIGVIRGLPFGFLKPIHATHKEYEMPISKGEREMRVKLKRDVVSEITIKMQKKGTETLGEQGDDQKDEDQ